MKIIIPMSGKGKRFVDAGYKDPKPLIVVDNKPIIKHVIDLFPREKDILCICNKEHIETTNMRTILESYGAQVHVIESHSLGPVYAVSQVFDQLDDEEEVIISYCDYGTVWNYEQFKLDIKNYDGGIVAYKGFHPHMLGTDNYAFMRCDGKRVLEIREKEPFTDNRMNEYASNGAYYFKKGTYVKKYFTELMQLGDLGKKNGEYYISLVYNLMIKDNMNVGVFEIDKMLQWGTPYDLSIYNMWSNHFKRAASDATQYNSNATLILPLAGQGSRFKMDGFSVPKPLLDINGKPMIIRAVESIPNCDKKVFVCLNEHLQTYPLKETLLEHFSNSQIIGIDTTTEGQACTCEIAIRNANISDNEPILISACDNGVDYNVNKYKELEENPDIDVIVWSFTNNPTGRIYPHMYAWLDVDDSNNIRYVSVKKKLEGAKHAIIGTMYFRRKDIYMKGLDSIYKNNIRTNGEYYVDNLLNPLIDMGYNVKVFEVDNYICWGTPSDYKTYQYWYEYFSLMYGQPLIM